MEIQSNNPELVHIGLPKERPLDVAELNEGILANRQVTRDEFIQEQKNMQPNLMKISKKL